MPGLPIWAPPLVAFCISLFTSTAGVSGAFLLVPLQVSMLGSMPSISATTHLFNVLATPGAVLGFSREHRLAWPLALLIVVGTIPGVVVGALIRVRWLHGAGPFMLLVAAVLGWLGWRLVRDLLKPPHAGHATAVEKTFHRTASQRAVWQQHPPLLEVTGAVLGRHSIGFLFCGQSYHVPLAPALALSAAVGLVGGIYGIGGGSIIAPFLVSVFGLPIYVVAGPALLGTLVTSAAGVLTFLVLAPFHPELAVAPDWVLGALLALGGFPGMLLGAKLQKRLPPRPIRGALAILALGLAAEYAASALRVLAD